MEEALKNTVNPQGELWEHYGDILWKLGRKEEALSNWKKAEITGGGTLLLDKKIKNNKFYE